jgi:hypothetical protein
MPRSIVDRKLRAYHQAVQLNAIVALYYPELRGATLSEIIARMSPARHSPDFRCVAWFGKQFHFTPAQSLVVEVLWKAWNHGTPRVGAAALLEAADMVSDKIADLFKRSEAWGIMIGTDGNGVYYLIPDCSQCPSKKGFEDCPEKSQ